MNLSDHIEQVKEDYGEGIALQHNNCIYTSLDCGGGITARLYTLPGLSFGWLIKTPLALTNKDYDAFLRLTTGAEAHGIIVPKDRLAYVMHVREGYTTQHDTLYYHILPQSRKGILDRLCAKLKPNPRPDDTLATLVQLYRTLDHAWRTNRSGRKKIALTHRINHTGNALEQQQGMPQPGLTIRYRADHAQDIHTLFRSILSSPLRRYY